MSWIVKEFQVTVTSGSSIHYLIFTVVMQFRSETSQYLSNVLAHQKKWTSDWKGSQGVILLYKLSALSVKVQRVKMHSWYPIQCNGAMRNGHMCMANLCATDTSRQVVNGISDSIWEKSNWQRLINFKLLSLTSFTVNINYL